MNRKYQRIRIGAWLLVALFPPETAAQRGCIIDLKPGDERLYAPSAPSLGKLHRWLELSAASVGIQYVFVKNGLGVVAGNQQQYQIAVTGRFKLDAKGRLSVNGGLFTGSSFIAGSNDTGLGRGVAQSTLYLKHLYLSAVPVAGVEIQYGGLNIWHDKSTDITGYAYNGYIVGERVSIKRPKNLFFDDISIGYGYVGDLNTPNVIRRADRLERSNFHRFIVRKDLGERAWGVGGLYLSGRGADLEGGHTSAHRRIARDRYLPRRDLLERRCPLRTWVCCLC